MTDPVRFRVEEPSARDTWTALLRPILVVPHALFVGGPFVGMGTGLRTGALGLVAAASAVVDWAAIVFTGRPVVALQEFKRLYLRWRAAALAYACLLRDEFPPFGEGAYPASLELPDPPAARRWSSVLLRPLLVVPHLLVLAALLVGEVLVWIVCWVTLVFARRMNAHLWRFTRDVVGYALRVEAYALLVHDVFPSFSLAPVAELEHAPA
jgi:hypothetical protein